MLGPTGHTDSFSRDHLPPTDKWPDFLLENFEYPDHLNAGFELTDAMVDRGFGDHTALIGNGRRRTYKERRSSGADELEIERGGWGGEPA